MDSSSLAQIPDSAPGAGASGRADFLRHSLRSAASPDFNCFGRDDGRQPTYGFKIVDRWTKEVIGEFPHTGALKTARDAVHGLFVDQHS
jgi:hypothetical protein